MTNPYDELKAGGQSKPQLPAIFAKRKLTKISDLHVEQRKYSMNALTICLEKRSRSVVQNRTFIQPPPSKIITSIYGENGLSFEKKKPVHYLNY